MHVIKKSTTTRNSSTSNQKINNLEDLLEVTQVQTYLYGQQQVSSVSLLKLKLNQTVFLKCSMEVFSDCTLKSLQCCVTYKMTQELCTLNYQNNNVENVGGSGAHQCKILQTSQMHQTAAHFTISQRA